MDSELLATAKPHAGEVIQCRVWRAGLESEGTKMATEHPN